MATGKKTRSVYTTPKIPPHNIEAEQSVLGACLISPEAVARVADLIRPDDFYRPDHSRIFAAMLGLFERGKPVDLISIAEALTTQNELEEAGGTVYLASLANAVPTAASLIHHAEIVREKSVFRGLAAASSRAIEAAYDAVEPVAEVLDRAQADLFSLGHRSVAAGFATMGTAVPEALRELQARYEKGGDNSGIPTGFRDLDRIVLGLQPGDLIIVAGRPGLGKTALALNMAKSAALGGIPASFISLEMSRPQLMSRLLSMQSGVDSNNVRSGRLGAAEWAAVNRAAEKLISIPLYINDRAALTIMDIRAAARRECSEGRCGIMFVDYIQLVLGSGSADSREREVGEISRSLKALAKELNIPVVALSQLNRKLEDRPAKRPQLADLRESGSIEQDADVILFVYRPQKYAPESTEPSEIIVGKQRNGPTGTVKVVYVESCASFEELANEERCPF
jgi:replicative DNA helicase